MNNSSAPEILLIDNYDSFTYNLYHYLVRAGARAVVKLNDDPRLAEHAAEADGLVISPGPSRPENAGTTPQIVKAFYDQKPLLGVCLGMQIINEVLGGKTIRSQTPVHGQSCRVKIIHPSPLFAGLPATFQAARYHSLICSDIPPELRLTSVYKTAPMSFEHRHLPLFGVQFHPESFLTPRGLQIIENFVRMVHDRLG
ncbi:anthranilate synthase component II [Caldithrix abyssi]|uniref:Anthranilate phosphoribosyltransferase/anthranilate synthase component 2 n=1 Tax=Caldithrix abyssi DSM 13497 TaxID=880073 RepID=H1XPG8_CALAY|nr:aminodeoxychorismate/anthranilate synthase component II [Caldithrix abyssi]APF19450.1 anthranilate phosphoribosyltransferase/anthranilate synthase component 2 [Caldithrix abyssi DSM 13497]EHO43339.1 glutamine amidotransferase of anthranilate synthase [Caldithrix abyssi DSM 13497]